MATSDATPETNSDPVEVRRGNIVQPSLRAGLIHLVSLYGLCVAQPLYDRFSQRPVFFELEGIRAPGLIALVVVISLAIPAVLLVLELLFAGCRPFVRHGVHQFLMGILSLSMALVLAQNATGSNLSPLSVLFVGMGGGVVLTLLYLFSDIYRTLLVYAVWGNVLFPIFFLYHATLGNPLSTKDSRLQQRIRIERPAPVILVVFDEICGLELWNKDREIDRRIVPNFGRLADDGVWYRNATAVHPRTSQAVPAILTGNRPDNRFEPQISQYPLNLFTLLLGSRDYSLTAIEPYSFLYPAEFDRELVIPRPVSAQITSATGAIPAVFSDIVIPRVTDLPPLPKSWFGVSGDRKQHNIKHFGKMRFDWSAHRTEQMDLFIESLRATSPLAPCYVQHIAIPHIPWCYYPDGSKYSPDDGSHFNPLGGLGANHETWCGDPLALELALFRHRMQLVLADRHVGRLIDKLKEIGLYDESLIIVAGDHGVSFQASHSRRLLTPEFSEDILSVPLIVKYPRSLPNEPQAGMVDDRNAEVIDILPTIADVIRMTLPSPVEGRSLLSADSPRGIKRFDNAGTMMEFPADAISRLAEQPLRWQLPAVAGGKFPTNYFPVGVHSELIGKQVSELKVEGPSELLFQPDEVVMKWSGDLDAVRPGYITGAIMERDGKPHSATLALALNGTIRTTTRTIEGLDVSGNLSTFIDPNHFQMGNNVLQVLEILESPAGLTLREIRRP